MPNPQRTQRTTFGKYSLKDQQLLPSQGSPVHTANTVAFLLSDESAFITGESIRIDGGVLAHQPYLMDRRRSSQDEQ